MTSSCLLTTPGALLSFFGSNSSGYFVVSGWMWAVLLFVIIFGLFFYFKPKIKEFRPDIAEPLPEPGLEMIQTSLYAGGHPEIREAIQPCYLFTSDGMIHFGKDVASADNNCLPVGSIPLETLVDIRVEDVFTLKRKMTPERWVQSKDFLQLLNNRKEEELAFVVIEWEKGGQQYITNLCVEGSLAMENALAKRNALYKKCRTERDRLSNLN